MVERKERPQSLEGCTTRVPTEHGTMYITVSWDPETGLPFEIFARLGKAGGCESAYLQGLGRVISVGLQCGISPSEYVQTLRNISCHPYLVGGKGENTSPVDAVARILEESYEEKSAEEGEQ